MNRRILFLAIILVLPFWTLAQDRQALEDTARKFFSHLMNNQVQEMEEMFTAEFLKMIPAGQLGNIANGLETQLGKFSHIKRSAHTTASPYETITLVAKFGEMDYGIMITMDTDLKIAGFHINMAPPESYTQPPQYANSHLFAETEVSVDAGDIQLPGLLTRPVGAENVPIVILVHGSGPNDMDESIGPNKIFRDIAQGLATRGIAVLRYEKRTLKHGESLDIENLTVWEETVSDAIHAVRAAMKFDGIDTQQVYVAGHSLGGMMAPRIAQKAPQLKGIISLAGSPRYLSDILPQQFEHLNAVRNDQSETALQNLERTRQFAASMDSLRNIPDATYDARFLGLSPSYWKDLNQHDLGEIAASLPQRILIIHGGRDYQVSMADYQAWKEALSDHPDAAFRLFDDLNHLFFKGENPSNPNEYFLEDNVDERVIDAIVEWVKEL